MKVVMTKGLPASGKSTWAKAQVELGGWKRINKDDLREMLDNSKWSRNNEKFVLKVRDDLIYLALQEGYSVIIDDTNLASKHEQRIRDLVNAWNNSGNDHVKFSIKDFTEVPLEECIKRDVKRQNSVGEKVIRGMYKQFLKPEVEKAPEFDAKLPLAILCDIDGTLAKMGDRSPYDWDKVDIDTINEVVNDALQMYRRDTAEIILLSGRDSVCRDKTEKWLQEHEVVYDQLLMRPEGDTRKDSIVKKELYEQNVKGKYNVWLVLDDRNQVVEMWRDLGLTCFQVAEGDF